MKRTIALLSLLSLLACAGAFAAEQGSQEATAPAASPAVQTPAARPPGAPPGMPTDMAIAQQRAGMRSGRGFGSMRAMGQILPAVIEVVKSCAGKGDQAKTKQLDEHIARFQKMDEEMMAARASASPAGGEAGAPPQPMDRARVLEKVLKIRQAVAEERVSSIADCMSVMKTCEGIKGNKELTSQLDALIAGVKAKPSGADEKTTGPAAGMAAFFAREAQISEALGKMLPILKKAAAVKSDPALATKIDGLAAQVKEVGEGLQQRRARLQQMGGGMPGQMGGPMPAGAPR